MLAMQISLIFLGGFLGTFTSIALKYGVNKGEFRKVGNYVFAVILSFAIYALYEFMSAEDFLPAYFSDLALFGIAVFLGFSIDELARGILTLFKREK